MIKKITMGALLLCSSGLLMAEEVVPDPTIENTQELKDPADAPATQMEPMQIRASTGEKDYVIPNASTGTKTDTPIMETPLSIQVIPQQVLKDQNITTLDQALRNVSGVKSDKFASQEVITLRGFTTSAVFRNGFRLDDTLGAAISNLSNVDSIEVLKGPAAILYGRVEPGGAVNIVTKQPKATPEYSIEQQVGSWNHFLTNLDVTGPVNEDKTILYRFNANYDVADSWRSGPTSNDRLFDRKLFIAPTLQWKISPQTQVTLEGEYNHYSVPYDIGQMNPFDSVNNRYVSLPRNQSLLAAPTDIDTTFLGLNWSHQFNDEWGIKQQLIHSTNRYNLPKWLTFNFAGPDLFTQIGNTFTVDRGLYQLFAKQKVDAAIQDLTGHFDTAGLKHAVLLGADYYRMHTYGQASQSSTFVTTDVFNLQPVTGLSIDPTLSGSSESTTHNYGVYVQDQIKFPHDVQLLAGLRYQKVKNSGTSITGTGNGGSGLPEADAPQNDHAVTPRIGLLWQARDWLSFYGNYAENFGANTGRDFAGTPLKPESAQQYEVGAKTELMGGKMMSTVALFDLTKQNVATADPLNPGFNLAIGEVRSRGAEFDIQGEILSGWDVIATYSYTDIKITKSNNGDEGLRMANVPRNMASLWNTYSFKQDPLLGWKIGGGVYWRDSAPDASNTLITPARAIFDAMASYEFKTGQHKVTAQLNINNLFNKRYAIDTQQFGNSELFTNGTPRSATASLKFEY